MSELRREAACASAMLLLGAIGMMLGLAIDGRNTGLAELAAICSQANNDLWQMMNLHWELLPWMHVGMWAGGFASIPLLHAAQPGCPRQYRALLAHNLACCAGMTVGMSAGALLAEALVPFAAQRSAIPMLAGMLGGMVGGMVASVALYRLVQVTRGSWGSGRAATNA